MSHLDTAVCLGIDWTRVDAPQLRLATPDQPGEATTIPLQGTLDFALASAELFCCGWFDLTGPTPRHRTCATWERLERGRQCRRCQYTEGFLGVHQAHRTEANLPDNVRAYMAQPHWLYLDVFPDGTMKVGTAAQSRRESRLAEQGPVSARYVAHADDGTAIRATEAAVARRFNLPQAVQTRRKIRGLGSALNIADLHRRLDDLTTRTRPYLDELAEHSRTHSCTSPELWTPPEWSQAVFRAAPVLSYPADLAQGHHTLHLHGVSGPIALITTSTDNDAPRYCADLTRLIGRHLTLNPPQAESPAPPPSLF